MSHRDDSEPFLSRWARRKRDAGRPDHPDSAAPGDRSSTNAEAGPLADGKGAPSPAGAPAEPPLDLSKLPEVDDLTIESDIAAFMDKRVPAALRNAALGRMWSLDPTIRDFIEVAENQWNWNVPGGAPFYELIEPRSAGSTIFADASSSIARSLDAPADPQEAVALSTARTDEESFPTHDISCPDDAAPPVEAARLSEELPEHIPVVSEPSLSSVGDAASQHDGRDSASTARRRHGTALPA